MFCSSEAFMVRPTGTSVPIKANPNTSTLRMSGDDDRLRALGYTEDEIERSRGQEKSKEEISVRVDLIPDVDPITLTAIGFGLIAFNFFVLGNLGDGGMGGFIATIINSQ